MAIPEDRQKAAIDEAAATITQTRAAVQDGLTAAFVGLQTPVNAAVARAEVTALRNLEV